MAINFPSSPSLYQIFTSGANSFIWNGKQWVGYSTSLTVNYNASSLALASNDNPVGATTSLNFDSNFNVQTLTGITTVSFSSTYIANSGYSTYSDYSNYSNSSGVSTYSATSGIASYADVAGISSGISTTVHINTTGIITAKSFYGSGIGLTSIPAGQLTGALPAIDGSALINLTAVGSGITVRDGFSIFSASTIDFGEHLTVNYSSGTATVNVTSSPKWNDGISGIHTLSNVGIGTTVLVSALTVKGNANISGVVTANSFSGAFVGDGSALTGIIAEGSGIEIRDGSSTIGIAATINFGDNLNVSPLSAGIVTVSSIGTTSYWVSNSSGIHTLSSVGIGTTNPPSPLSVYGNVFINGNTNTSQISAQQINIRSDGLYFDSNISSSQQHILIENNNVGGDIILKTSYTDIVGTSRTENLTIYSPNNESKVRVHHNLVVDQKVGIGTTNPTSTLTVQGNGRFSGIVTATSFSGTNLNVSGTSTFGSYIALGSGSAFIDYSGNNVVFTQPSGTDGSDDTGGFKFITTNPGLPPSQETSLSLYSAGSYWDRLVRVHRNLQVDNNITVNGTSTLSSNVSIGGTVNVSGGVKLATNNATIVGTSGTLGEIKQIGGAPFYYDGSAWREFVLSSGTPVTVPADTEWDNVVFRATFDDNFTDAKFNASPVYVSSGSTIVGAAVTIGTGAFRNDGAVGSGISYAYRSDYDFTGSWTIEFWMYVDSNPAYNNPLSPLSLVSMHSTTGIGTSGNWTLAMWEDLYANKYISWFNQNSTSYRGGASLYYESGAAWNSTILDKWNHFAIVREGDNGSIHFYVNGVERSQTINDTIIDNDILDINGAGLHFGGDITFTIGALTFNSNASADVIFDDVRISCGVGTAGQRYTSVGSATTVFTPPTTSLPTTGTLSSYIQPPGDKYGEITLGGSPSWRGTSGVTVSQQSSGNYRVSFASSYTSANDYYVLSQGMDQGFASYVGIARSTTHVDFTINRQSDNTAVNTGSLAVQIKNHI